MSYLTIRFEQADTTMNVTSWLERFLGRHQSDIRSVSPIHEQLGKSDVFVVEYTGDDVEDAISGLNQADTIAYCSIAPPREIYNQN